MKPYKITDFTQHTDDPTSYEGTVVLNGEELGVSIILEDESETEKIEQQMNYFFSEIDTLSKKAKECIAEKYLDLYNSNWRFGDDDEDDPEDLRQVLHLMVAAQDDVREREDRRGEDEDR